MKKIVAIIAIVASMAIFYGCTEEQTEPSTTPPGSSQPPPY
jgi:hypothetical protein